MSDLRNIASRYFDGFPVSNSGEPLIGDAEDFVMKIFPDEILSQVEGPDGSISYFDSKGDVVAVIDADGNVYVNRGGEVLVYEAPSDDEPEDDAADVFNDAGDAEGVFGPAKGECVSGDFGAEVCEANDFYREDVQQCIPPGPDAQTAMANAAKNLFGSVEEFVDGVFGEDADEDGIEEDDGIFDEMGEFLDRVVEEAGDVVEKVVEIVEDAVEYVSKKASDDPSKEAGDKGEKKTEDVPVEDEPDDDGNSYETEVEVANEGLKPDEGPGGTLESIEKGGVAPNGADDAGPGGFEPANQSYSSYPEVPDAAATDLNGGLIMQELMRRSGIADALPDKTKAAAAAFPYVAQPAMYAILSGAIRYVHYPQGRSSKGYDISSMGAMAAAHGGGSQGSPDAAHQKVQGSYLTSTGAGKGDGLDPFCRTQTSPRCGSGAVRIAANGLGLLGGLSAADDESNPGAIAYLTKALGGMPFLFANFASGGIAAAAGNARENPLSVKAPHHHGNPSDQNGERDGKRDRGDDQEQDGEDDEGEVLAIQ